MLKNYKPLILTVQKMNDRIGVFDGEEEITSFKDSSVADVVSWLNSNLKNATIKVL